MLRIETQVGDGQQQRDRCASLTAFRIQTQYPTNMDFNFSLPTSSNAVKPESKSGMTSGLISVGKPKNAGLDIAYDDFDDILVSSSDEDVKKKAAKAKKDASAMKVRLK